MTFTVIGREPELAEADRFLDDAGGHPSVLLLVGAPGIGKTTVWSTVVETAAARGFVVLRAHPAQGESDLPFGALADLFADVPEEMADGLPEVQRHAFDAALRRRAESLPVDPTAVALATLGIVRALAASAPLLVAVDDLQWADLPSRRALGFAVRRLAAEPVGVLATVRAGFDLDGLGAPIEARVSRLEVIGLDDRAVARLVLERTGRTLTPQQLRRVVDATGGNPLHALELAAIDDPGRGAPESLAAALQTRLAQLSDEARSLGLTAAVLGRFDPSIPGGLHGAALDELRAADVVLVRAGLPVFAHPLLASTLVEMHTLEERRAVHRSLASILSDADERALHRGRGSDRPSEAVASELERAADRLDGRGAPETAASLWERAAALTPEDRSADRTRRLIRAADLHQAAGDGADHALPLLTGLAESLRSGPARARVLVRIGWLGAMMDTLPASEAIDYQHRALAEGEGDDEVVVAAHAVLARLTGNAGDYHAAASHAELALAADSYRRSNGMFPSPVGETAFTRFIGGRGLDEELFQAGIERTAVAGRVEEPYQTPDLQLALALLYAGRLAESRRRLLCVRARAEELGRVRSTAGCCLHLVELEVRAGDLAAAEAYAAEFEHLDRLLRGELGTEWYPSGLVALHAGREQDARRILDAGIAYSRSIESTVWLAHQLGALGHLELVQGRLPEARGVLGEAVPLLRAAGLGEWAVHPVHPDLIEALVGLGELDEAEALTGELDEYGSRVGRPWGIATAARSAALVAAARGRREEALDSIARASAAHADLDWPLERARTHLVEGTLLRRAGRRRDAAAALATAHAVLSRVRNPLWLARVEAEQARLGGRRGTGDELTPTEERVARLAAEGLRNAEIAARLFVTPKTVEATLSRVYRKLDVRSRTELTRDLSA